MINKVNVKSDVLMARQGIYDGQNVLFGYELLYRGHQFNLSSPEDQYGATIEVLSNLASIVLSNNIDCSKKVFVNVDQSFLESPSFFPSNARGIVLELLETIIVTPQILKTVKKLKNQGFEFALDDYSFEVHHAPLLPYVNYVKIDLMECPVSVIEGKIDALRAVTDATLLAEKIDNACTYKRCKELGFSLFQGFYLEKPTLVEGVKVKANKQLVLKILSEISRDNVSAAELSQLLSCDPRLVTKTLMLVNSPLFSRRQKISCIKHAVVTLGLESVQKWLMVMTLVSESSSPIELFRILLARARLLELFALSKRISEANEYFMLGLFSELDTVLSLNMRSVVASVPLSNSLYSALLYQKGKLGRLLKDCLNWEKGLVEQSDNDNVKILAGFYWESQQWADSLLESLN